MKGNEKLKETDIENRTCYHFDDIIEIKDFDVDNILKDEKKKKTRLKMKCKSFFLLVITLLILAMF